LWGESLVKRLLKPDDLTDEGIDGAGGWTMRLDEAVEMRDSKEALREMVVAVPLSSLSSSSVGSLLTNSFCSNWTTT
jgi:hypothetical protein